MPTASRGTCRFCSIVEGTADIAALHDSPWLKGEQYAAFVSVGALVKGWSLVAPRQHTLNLLSQYGSKAFFRFLDQAHRIVTKDFGPTVVFEHGSQHHLSQTSCGTAHAHMHLVPLSFSLESASEQFDETLRWQTCRATEISSVVAGNEYLFVADRYDSDATVGQLAILREGRSQFFRQVIATRLGCPDLFDYKTHPQYDLTKESARRLLNFSNAELASVA